MKTVIYVQDANDPDRRILAGHYDLPRTLSSRALANFPFACFGIEPGDVADVALCQIGGKRACVIRSAAPLTCPDLLVNLSNEIAEAVELQRPHFPADDETTLRHRAVFFRPERYRTGQWPDFAQIAKDEAAIAEAAAQEAAAAAAANPTATMTDQADRAAPEPDVSHARDTEDQKNDETDDCKTPAANPGPDYCRPEDPGSQAD